jgi:endonuclease/exonuclease/phosphatase (EEP) superfamily protein YafD
MAGMALTVASGVHSRRLRSLSVAALVPLLLLSHAIAPTVAGMVFPERSTDGVRLSVLAQNVWFENEDPATTLDAAMKRRADVVVLTEFTPEFERHLDERAVAGWRSYPHQWRDARPGGSGLAVLSSFPFEEAVRVPLSMPAVRVRLRVGEGLVDLYAVHPVAPSDRWGLLQWQNDYRVLIGDATDAGPMTIMAGDFNATRGHRTFRRLLEAGGLRDAQDVAGAGLAGTWPSGGALPRVMRLDHVLVGEGIGVEAFEVLPFIGSDHLGVEAVLRVPRS